MLYACFRHANAPSSSTGMPIKKRPTSRLRYVLLIPEPQDVIIIIANEAQPRFGEMLGNGVHAEGRVSNSNGYYRRRLGEAEQKRQGGSRVRSKEGLPSDCQFYKKQGVD